MVRIVRGDRAENLPRWSDVNPATLFADHPAERTAIVTGDAPERILRSRVSIAGPWERRCEIGEPVEVLRPEHAHEGPDEPCVSSIRGAVDEPVNQLRDPCLFCDPGDGTWWLFCAVAGESGIAVARL